MNFFILSTSIDQGIFFVSALWMPKWRKKVNELMKEEVRLKLNSFYRVQLQEVDVISIWITELKP